MYYVFVITLITLLILNIIMTESLKQIVNRDICLPQKSKFINSISQLCTQDVNRSIEYGSDNDSSFDNQQVLRMEIKQLKRQNTFLKIKIQQLKAGRRYKHQITKRKSINCMNAIKQRQEQKKINQFSLAYFMQEITDLLKSVSILFKAHIPQTDWLAFSQEKDVKINSFQQSQIAKQQKQFSVKINKKLELLALKKQQCRYQHLIDIFSQLYVAKLERQKHMKNRVQHFIQKAIHISKIIINKAQEKSLKSSSIYNINNYEDQTNQIVLDNKQQQVYNNVNNSLYEKDMFSFQKFKRDSPNNKEEKSQLCYSVIVQPNIENDFQ